MNKKLFIPIIILSVIVLIILLVFVNFLLLKNYTNKELGFDFFYENNSESCEGIDNIPYRDICYNSVAWNTNNSNLCEKINDGRQKDICFKVFINDTSEEF